MTGMHGNTPPATLAESDLPDRHRNPLSDRATGTKTESTKGKKVIHIDIDPSEIGKNIPWYVAPLATSKPSCKELL